MNVSNNTATEFQMNVFFDLVGRDRAGSDKMKKLLANLSPELMLVLMQVLQDGTVDGKDEAAVARLKQAGVGQAEVEELSTSLNQYVGTWKSGSTDVEAWMRAMGFNNESHEMQAEIADVFKDGVVSDVELTRMRDLGLVAEEDFASFQEAARWVTADGNVPLSQVSEEGLETLRRMTGQLISFGDWMLLLMLLIMNTFQKRIKDLSSSLADKQLAASKAQFAYTQHLSDPRSTAAKDSAEYEAWSKEKEQLKMKMEDNDEEVQEMLAEMKRMMDKFDTMKQLFQGIITQIGQMEKSAAQAIGQ